MSATSLIRLGKVLGGVTMKQAIKVHIPQMKLDSYILTHFRESDEVMAHDPKEQAKPGDWVLIRPLQTPVSLKVKHELVKIVYTAGDRICPLTGKKIVGTEFLDEIEMESRTLGWVPLAERVSSQK